MLKKGWEESEPMQLNGSYHWKFSVCVLSDDEHVAQGADRHGWCGINFTNTQRHTHSISLLNMLPLHLNLAIPQGEYPLLSMCACSFVCIYAVGGPVLDPLKFVHGISVKLPIPTHISHGHHETNVAVEQGSRSVPESVKGFAVWIKSPWRDYRLILAVMISAGKHIIANEISIFLGFKNIKGKNF